MTCTRPRRPRADAERRRNTILHRLSEGFTEAEVARALGVCTRTVRRAKCWLRDYQTARSA